MPAAPNPTLQTPCARGAAHEADQAGAARRLPGSIVLLMALCSGISVANVYYAQPLLDAIASDFGISHAAVGGVITATQIGCALALLLVVPLGDLLDRKRLLYLQLLLLGSTLLVLTRSDSPAMLLLGMAGAGLLGTAMTQGLIAYAATLAHPSERGRVVGTVQSGVVTGLLAARSLAGVVTDLAGWRTVYLMSAILAAAMLLLIWRVLPAVHAARSNLGYPRLLASMLSLLARERVLRVRGVIGFLLFAAFGAFWSALVLPLSAPPLNLSHSGIGAFGMIGVVGALAAARAGRWADRGLGQRTTGIAIVCLIVCWLPIAMLHHSLWWLALGVILLDLGAQALHVVNQSMIFGSRPDAHSRLVGCYMLFYSAGSGLGAIAATWIYAHAGWTGVCLLGTAIGIAALLFWITTRRWMESAPAST